MCFVTLFIMEVPVKCPAVKNDSGRLGELKIPGLPSCQTPHTPTGRFPAGMEELDMFPHGVRGFGKDPIRMKFGCSKG